MQVFRCALKLIFKNISIPLIYLVGLSFMGVLMAFSFNFGGSSDTFERTSYDFAVIDRDGSAVSQSINDMLGRDGDRVDVKDDTFAIQDAIAKGEVDYLLIIPEGYEAELVDSAKGGADAPELEVVYSFYAIDGALVDESVNEYVGLLNSMLSVEPDAPIEDVIASAFDLSNSKSEVSIVQTDSQLTEADRFIFYMQWSTYSLFAGIVVCIGTLISSMGRSDVRKRNLASPISYASYNVQLALACLVLTVFACVWTFGLGAIIFADAVAQMALSGVLLCALDMFCYCLIGLAFGYMLGSFGASAPMCNAIGNIGGLLISFMGGAWLSLSLMGPGVVAFAHWLPGVWYSEAAKVAGHLNSIADVSQLVTIAQCMGILLLYAIAFFSIAIFAGRLRMQTSKAS